MTLGRKIKDIREGLGLSQEKFAEKLGTSTGYIGNIETDKRQPGRDLIMRICKIFGIPSSEFFEAPKAAERKAAYAPEENLPEIGTLGQRLRYFREAILGVTHKEFAKGTPANFSDIADYELDKAVPDARFLTAVHSKYNEVLEESLMEWLLDGKAVPRPTFNFLMREIMTEVERFLKKEKLTLSPAKKSDLCMAIYEELQRGEAKKKDLKKRVAEVLRKAS